MSKSVDLFIDTDQSAEAVAGAMERLAQLSTQAGELPSTWIIAKGDMRAELRVNPYVSDGELDLERYAYVLSARTSGNRLTDSPEASLLRAVADRLRPERMRTLLVHDLEFRDKGAPAAAPPPDDDGTEPAAAVEEP